MRGQQEPGPGLLGVMRAHRELGDLSEAITRLRIPLPTPQHLGPEAGVARDFLPGFAHLQAVDPFEGVWGPFARALRSAPYDTIVDAGRIERHGLPDELVEAAHQVAVVTRTSLSALAALRLYLPPLLEQADVGRVGLVLVGAGRPYGAKEIAEQFGVPVLAEIDWQPGAAAELAEGRGLTLIGSALGLRANVSARLEQWRAEAMRDKGGGGEWRRRNRRSHGSSALTTHGLSIPRRGFRMRTKLPAHIAGHVSRIAVTRGQPSFAVLPAPVSTTSMGQASQAKMRPRISSRRSNGVRTVESQRRCNGRAS